MAMAIKNRFKSVFDYGMNPVCSGYTVLSDKICKMNMDGNESESPLIIPCLFPRKIKGVSAKYRASALP